MKTCKICGKPANTDRLLCKECLRLKRSGHLGKDIPIGKDFMFNNKRYVVTEDGKVFSTITFKYLTPIVMKNGYIMYSFGSASNGTRKQIYAHRLVAYCYGILKSLDDDMCIDHIDGNKSNNHVSNLRAVTYSENELYKKHRKGKLFAINNQTKKTLGPYNSVKEMYNDLQINGTLGSFYTQVSRGAGYGYTFVRANTEVTTEGKISVAP